MTEKKLFRFDLKKADRDIARSKSFWGAVGNSAIWLAKGTVNVSIAVLEEMPETLERMKERQGKK